MILAISRGQQTPLVVAGHYVSSNNSNSSSIITAAKIWRGEGRGCESKMAVAAGVICLGGVEQSQCLLQPFNSSSAVAMLVVS